MMKKTLVAMAALAVTGAFAQSTVTITGIMDGYVGTGKQFGQDISLIQQSGARTTSFQFLGSEDLGGGLRANFRYEIQPAFILGDGNRFSGAAATTTGQASRESGFTGPGQSWVSLSSTSMGEVRIGTVGSQLVSTWTTGSQGFGTGIGSFWGSAPTGLNNTSFSRIESAVQYRSPVLGGFSFNASESFSNQSAYGASASGSTALTLARPQISELGLNFTQGKLTVNGSVYQTRAATSSLTSFAPVASAGAADVTATTTTLAGRYDFGFASLAVLNQRLTNDAATTATATSLSVTTNMVTASVPLGMNRVMVSLANRKTDGGTIVAGVTGETSTGYGLAFERDLSKRTYVYLRAEALKMNDLNMATQIIDGAAGVNATANRDRSLLGVGISHAF